MATTIVTNLPKYNAAFGSNILEVTNPSANIVRFLIEVEESGDTVLLQYTTKYDNNGIFNLRKSFSSLVSGVNDLIVTLNDGDASVLSVDEHSKRYEILLHSLDGDASIQATGSLGFKNIHKAVNNEYVEKWFTNDSFLAYNITDDNKYRVAFAKQYIPISFYSDEDSRIIELNDTSTLSAPTTNGYSTVLYKDDGTDDSVKISIQGTSEGELTYYVDFNEYPRTKTLYFLNKYGGWEWYNFIDYEITKKVDKENHIFYADAYGNKKIGTQIYDKSNEYKLFGRPGTADWLHYIKDLVTSPVVYDENGDRVMVLDDNILYDAEGILEPELTIRYLSQNQMNY